MVTNFPLSQKFGPVGEVDRQNGKRSIQRLADAMYNLQGETKQDVEAYKREFNIKHDDVAYHEFFNNNRRNQKQKKANSKLEDLEDERNKNLKIFIEENRIGMKEAVVCSRLSSDTIGMMDLQKLTLKQSRIKSLQ